MKKTLLTATIFFTGLLSAQTNYNNPGGLITTDSGNFNDAGGPGTIVSANYLNNENTVTTICAQSADSCISVTFNQFSLSNNPVGADNLRIFDGKDTISGLIGTYIYNSSPKIVTSSKGCLTFNFKSDAANLSFGWQSKITITSKCASQVINSAGTSTNVLCFAKFYDTGGSNGNYKNNENSVTTFCPKEVGDSITVNFSSFTLDSKSADVLKIYNAADTLSGFIKSYRYTAKPSKITSSLKTNPSGCLTFKFSSNSADVDRGWDADISVNNPTVCPRVSVVELSALNNGFDIELVNPIGNVLEGQLYAKDNKVFTLEIIDIQGKILHVEKMNATKGTNKVSINTNDLESGLYFVKLSDENYSLSKKIIKE